MQIECIIPVLAQATKEAGMKMTDIHMIAVTRGPGLLGSILVGTVTARALASMHKKPLIGVHHTLGHLSSTWLERGLILENPGIINPKFEIRNSKSEISFPVLTLSASGGHTELWHRTSHTQGRLLGHTRDDAAGEAFDKGAYMLGLAYPGGPSIQKAAEGGDAKKFGFPLPLCNEDTLDFSFSGLKTSLKYLLRDLATRNSPASRSTHRADAVVEPEIRNIAAGFQHAICRHLTDRIRRAIKHYPDIKEIHLVGGVSANIHLRNLVVELCAAKDTPIIVRVPASLDFCTDNAAMIAAAGEFMHRELWGGASAKFDTRAAMPLRLTSPAT